MKSRSSNQLSGKYMAVTDLGACDPIIQVSNLSEYQKVNMNGIKMPDDAPAIPCGLIAKSFFTDSFTLMKEGVEGSPDIKINISSENIAWTSDRDYAFKNIKADTIPAELGTTDYRDI